MNSKQLAHQVAMAVTRRGISQITLDAAQELIEALNLSLATWLQMLAQDRRITTFGAKTVASVTQSIQVVSGSKEFAYTLGGGAYPVGGFASESDAIGATVQLAGTVSRNQLQGPGRLLLPHTGASGTVSMTIFGDAVHLPADCWSVEGEVLLTTGYGVPVKVLQHSNARQFEIERTFYTGEPREWWMESISPLTEEESRRFVLRVWPRPDTSYSLRIPIGLFPSAFTHEDLHEARSLPFQPLEASLFISMAKGIFAASSYADPKVNIAGLQSTGERATEQLRTLTGRPTSTQADYVGTPYGY